MSQFKITKYGFQGNVTGSLQGTASYAKDADTVDGRHAGEFDTVIETDDEVTAAAILDLRSRIEALEQKLSSTGNLGNVVVDNLSVLKSFNNYSI